MDCKTGSVSAVCWFCRKGRHCDCMRLIPKDARADGPHDCTFDTNMVPCACDHAADSN